MILHGFARLASFHSRVRDRAHRVKKIRLPTPELEGGTLFSAPSPGWRSIRSGVQMEIFR